MDELKVTLNEEEQNYLIESVTQDIETLNDLYMSMSKDYYTKCYGKLKSLLDKLKGGKK